MSVYNGQSSPFDDAATDPTIEGCRQPWIVGYRPSGAAGAVLYTAGNNQVNQIRLEVYDSNNNLIDNVPYTATAGNAFWTTPTNFVAGANYEVRYVGLTKATGTETSGGCGGISIGQTGHATRVENDFMFLKKSRTIPDSDDCPNGYFMYHGLNSGNVEYIGPGYFSKLEKIIGQYAFCAFMANVGCSVSDSLSTIALHNPNLTQLNDDFLESLIYVNSETSVPGYTAPVVTSFLRAGFLSVQGLTKTPEFFLRSLRQVDIPGYFMFQAFYNCPNLTRVSLGAPNMDAPRKGQNSGGFFGNTFGNTNTGLVAYIWWNTTLEPTFNTLNGNTMFSNTYLKNLYVPAVLVSDYRTSASWSNITDSKIQPIWCSDVYDADVLSANGIRETPHTPYCTYNSTTKTCTNLSKDYCCIGTKPTNGVLNAGQSCTTNSGSVLTF
jgi:hypothetical protein